MNLVTMLPSIAQLPSAIGPLASPGDFGEMLRILVCLALIVGSGSIAAACVDGLVTERSPARARKTVFSAASVAALRSAIIRCYLMLKGK